METVYLILAGIAIFALGFFLGIFYNRYKHSKAVKSMPSQPSELQTKPLEYNSEYLTAEESFTFEGRIINQYHHDKQLATYEQILGVNHNNASQCRKLVRIKLSAEEDVQNSATINAFWDKLKEQNKLIMNRYMHIIVEQDKEFYVAYAYLDSNGNLYRIANSLASGYRWYPEDGVRFLLP